MSDAMENTSDNSMERWAEEGVPEKLREGLAGIYGRAPAISRKLDEAILSGAREQAARRARMRWVMRYAIGSVAAAAAVILVVFKVTHHDRGERTAQNSVDVVAVAEDLNHDGKIDILDAYLMAKSLAANEAHAKDWDFNRDGTVDAKDVEVVALAAVKLRGGEVR